MTQSEIRSAHTSLQCVVGDNRDLFRRDMPSLQRMKIPGAQIRDSVADTFCGDAAVPCTKRAAWMPYFEMTRLGLEPRISGSGGRRLIH